MSLQSIPPVNRRHFAGISVTPGRSSRGTKRNGGCGSFNLSDEHAHKEGTEGSRDGQESISYKYVCHTYYNYILKLGPIGSNLSLPSASIYVRDGTIPLHRASKCSSWASSRPDRHPVQQRVPHRGPGRLPGLPLARLASIPRFIVPRCGRYWMPDALLDLMSLIKSLLQTPR